MPSCAPFDLAPQIFDSGAKHYDNALFDSANAMQFLDQKKFVAALYPFQPEQQLLTPPASPQPFACSPFDDVPFEILDQILGLVHDDNSRGIYDVLRDISACCLVSRQFHTVGTNWLYRHVPISDPYAFTKFLTQISQHPEKGFLVKTLDFSPFSVVSLGRSANDNKQIKMVCSETLSECLNLVPNLQELLLSEAVDPDLDINVLMQIFNPNKLPKLEALDFCGSSRPSFVQAFEGMLRSHIDPVTHRILAPFPPIRRLSLHGCQTLPANIYPRLLPLLHGLTHLDLSSTQITSLGLRSISPHARLQHLYLGNCGGISGRALLSFLLDHPASTGLESLNVRVNDELNHPLSPREVPLFLSALKSKGTLRALDICGLPVSDEHALDFPSTLVELGIHRTGLSPQGIQTLLSLMPHLFYLDLEANLSGGRLRLSHYADVFAAIRKKHSHVKVVECSGSGIEATDEIYDVLYGWHWLHGRSRRGWLVNKSEFEKLQKANRGIVKIGWKMNKLNCCTSRKDLYGHYWYYAYGR